jgi:glycosyltransferase involved in cell wall biosynthesis
VSQPLRVLYITAGYAVEGANGGISRFVIDLVQELDRSVVSPSIYGLWNFGTDYEPDWMDRLKHGGIHAWVGPSKIDASPYRNFADSVSVARGLIPAPIDIIHSHSEFGDVAALLLQRAVGARKIVRTIHNGGGEWRMRPLRRLLLSNGIYPLTFDAELAVSTQLVESLNRRPLARLLGRKGALMPNAIRANRFSDVNVDRHALLTELGLPPSALIIGTVGRLAPEKGLDVLLSAAPTVIKAIPTAHFLIVGDGPVRFELEALAATLGISDHVHFTGPRHDVPQIDAALDLFVSAAHFEGLPTSLMEAALAGAPIVATAVSGNLELFAGLDAAIFVSPGNVQALSDAMILALTEPADSTRLRVMAERARTAVHQRFSMTAVARKHEALYRNLGSP